MPESNLGRPDQGTSRGAFLVRLAKFALVGTALGSAGVALDDVVRPGTVADAAPFCCTGSATCQTTGCPGNSSVSSSYTCCNQVLGQQYQCNDCYLGSCYICTYGTTAGSCPHTPVHSTAGHGAVDAPANGAVHPVGREGGKWNGR